MLNSIQELLNYVGGKSIHKVGNDKLVHQAPIQNFYYYDTLLCSANWRTKEFKIANTYQSSRATNRRINEYRHYFISVGMTEIR